jgi:hypothetical protein
MSASMETTRFPASASAIERFAVVVVLPTPPFPEVTVITIPAMNEVHVLAVGLINVQ